MRKTAEHQVNVSPSTFYEAQRSRTALPQASLLIVDSTAREANLSYKIREDETRLGSRHVAISSFSRQSVSVRQSVRVCPLHSTHRRLLSGQRGGRRTRRGGRPIRAHASVLVVSRWGICRGHTPRHFHRCRRCHRARPSLCELSSSLPGRAARS